MPILKELKQHKILLDTHVWLWTMAGSSELSKEFSVAFDRILKGNGVLISVMSIWEVGMLAEKKRIELDMDVMDWIEQALVLPGINLSSITPRIAIQSTRLDGTIHGDPVDRLLIATAHEENAVLVTCDEKIIRYGKDKFISVYDPST